MSADIRSRVKAIARGEATDSNECRIDLDVANRQAPVIKALAELATSRKPARPMHLPSEAFGIWG